VLFADNCGDVDDSGGIDIDDIVYLIAYVFTGGLPPDCGVSPSEIGTVTDIDGNLYYTAKIGEQWWMIENLRATHYRNGDPIPHVVSNSEWGGLSTGAYCEYENDPTNVSAYGRLYNWYAVDDPRGLAPEGWHIPTDDDWKQLEMFLGMTQAEADEVNSRGTDEGHKMRQSGTTHWISPNQGASNASGFSALPSGYRHSDGLQFSHMNSHAFYWCSTGTSPSEAWTRRLESSDGGVYRYDNERRCGFSVRCVRD
jgi:uncharacterized protein (TIGR02145 family)